MASHRHTSPLRGTCIEKWKKKMAFKFVIQLLLLQFLLPCRVVQIPFDFSTL
jgi:hypothetical protein